MKITIDTVNKTIKVEENTGMSELVSFLKRIFPHEEWKEYTIKSHETIHEYYPFYPYPLNPPYRWTNGYSQAVGDNNKLDALQGYGSATSATGILQ